jgi:predicted AAA+ superfamily ATPase
LILFENVTNDPIVKKATALFALFGDDAKETASALSCTENTDTMSQALKLYADIQKAMLDMVGAEEAEAGYWQNYICKLIGPTDNAFSRMSEKGVFADEPCSYPSNAAKAVFDLAVKEMDEIRHIYAYDFQALNDVMSARAGISLAEENLAKLVVSPAETSRRQRIHEALSSADSRTATTLLARYYRSFGAGYFEGYDAFRWTGELRGVGFADPVAMDDLIGCESQKKVLIENTEFLLAGLPSNNMLLYGDSGTGKSSSIKALLNMYKDRGLKLIDVPKEHLEALPDILEYVGGRGLKFIIFIDDLSFEENEVGYKAFKSVMEGSVGARAANTIICVTSNRRNIVKEVWKDRENEEDIHLRDNLQEKRSLADRFGLIIVYVAPMKREYLEIVLALAKKSGLDMDEEYLKEQALVWEIRHGGRSGRTARQFIDYMIGAETLKTHRQEDAHR